MSLINAKNLVYPKHFFNVRYFKKILLGNI